jgi:hypothetical protein
VGNNVKKEQRQLYRAMIEVLSISPFEFPNRPYNLCEFCRYCSGPYSDEDSVYCDHDLEKVTDNANNVWYGDDCWGFRPRNTLAIDLADYGFIADELRLVADGNVSKRHEPDSIHKCVFCDKELPLIKLTWGLLCADCWDYWTKVRLRINRKYFDAPLNLSGVTTGRFKVNDPRS